ncbi:alpha/beta hydrolase [Flavobacterium humi]|uniref:Alpha/beta hydrolase n=1 Tax=Flavobacterium humi TaxID=2562683 RepID=A0A4Z0LAY2_9FLAO|nr:alpha/beta hydrolase [Flavobacterium humi]TGD58746.1 alpha/beta hydrolase [Flavobacterium humi]
MKTTIIKQQLKSEIHKHQKSNVKRVSRHFFLFAAFIFSLLSMTSYAQTTAPVKNVVLVHGAFADGSGWKGLYKILTQKGYHVTIVQNPLTSLEDDVAATNAVLDKQDGPTILVGHSWGGAVITQAGNHPKVAALVYVAAFQPDNGESVLTWVQKAPPAPENGILAPDAKGIVYYDQAKYHAGFCADISKADADFMYASQGAFHAKGFVTPLTQAAWHEKPSYGIVATEDKSINPDIQRTMYKRSGAKITEIKGSHVVFISQPELVVKVIVAASKKE